MLGLCFFFFFFFQAEDGIRDLTVTGVQTCALPISELEGVFVAPRTKVERALAEVWAEALGVRQVGIDDNYFALGGDSIRSIRVRAGALARGLDFSLQQLFQHPTIRELAEQVSVAETRHD